MKVQLRVQPGASRDQVGGAYDAPDAMRLRVKVTARAVDGAANAAVARVLAAALGLKPREVSLLAGHTSRNKTVEVPDSAAPQVARLLSAT